MVVIKKTEKECNELCKSLRSVIKGECLECGEDLKEHDLSKFRSTKLGCPKNERFCEIIFPVMLLLCGIVLGGFIFRYF